MKNAIGSYPIKTFDDFRNVAQLYQYSRVILTALDLDVFTIVSNRSWTIPGLARRLGTSVRGLQILARNLAALGLLAKKGESYRNSVLAKRELNRNSPGYRGEYLALIHSHWDDHARLTQSVRRGKPLDEDKADNPKWRRSFTWAMHHRSREQAQRVADILDLRRTRTLLDLGGGPGTYAMAFLTRNRSLRATVADRPAALKVARAIAANHPSQDRLSFAPVDFMRDSVPQGFDVVWLSNVIHIYSPAENIALFKRVAKALAPGGRLIIQDSFLTDRAGLYPIETTAFAITMLLFTDRGNTYGAREVRRWLKQAGFSRVRSIAGLVSRKYGENGLLEGKLKKTAHR
jgi:SAM-dependent methyltransferase